MVVAGTDVAEEFPGFWKGGDEGGVETTSDTCGLECSVGGDDIVEGSRMAFVDEFLAAGCFWDDDFDGFGEGFPVRVGAEVVS